MSKILTSLTMAGLRAEIASKTACAEVRAGKTTAMSRMTGG
jgi:hypothetical protein